LLTVPEGPNAKSISQIGSKSGAKRLIRSADSSIPLIPGYDGEDQSVEGLTAQANRIGYPVLIKASAGGGGKGMRVVRSAADVRDAIEVGLFLSPSVFFSLTNYRLQSSKSESKNAFGDDFLLIEKYFDAVRHIEVPCPLPASSNDPADSNHGRQARKRDRPLRARVQCAKAASENH
jgi:3-methylcrotonyl-CoA carboxylase alpha subunit